MSEAETPLETHAPDVPSGSAEDRIRLFNLSLDLLCVAGIDGYFRHVNPSWTRVLGWTREELLSRPVESFMHPEDRERTLAARAALAQGVPVRGLENRYLCKDGSYRWLSWQSNIEPGGDTVFAIARDITDRRQNDRENLILSKLESSATLASGIAHDFNNLLTGLQLNLDMLELSGPVNAQQNQNLGQARDIVESARALTHQLVLFANRDRQGAPSVLDLAQFLPEVFQIALRGTNLRGEHDVPAGLHKVEVMSGDLAQAIRNLVGNARDAMPAGGLVTLSAANVHFDQNENPEFATGDYVRISVRDEGPGIPEQLLPKVLDPYFTTKPRGSEKGMGMGLTIVHAVLQKHGGMLTIKPTAAGTTVHCYLPATPAPVAETPVAPAVETQERRAITRVLVMDDEPTVCEVIEQSLMQLGCEVLLAEDGEAALTLFDEAREQGDAVDLALLDLTVRGGPGGVEVLRDLRAKDAALRAVLMTGYERDPAVREYRAHGFSAVLGKPFSLDDLRRLLSSK